MALKQIIKIFLVKFYLYVFEKHLSVWVSRYKMDNLKSTFKSVGENVHLPAKHIIKNPKYISIGNNFFALNNLRLEAWDCYLDDLFEPCLEIGNNVSINTDCHIGCIGKVSIGDQVMIASRVYISDHSHGHTDLNSLKIPVAQRKLVSKGPVIIEANVWIGEGVCIMPGVVIGRNSIIGANSVVTKSFPENTIIAGVPAKDLKAE